MDGHMDRQMYFIIPIWEITLLQQQYKLSKVLYKVKKKIYQ